MTHHPALPGADSTAAVRRREHGPGVEIALATVLLVGLGILLTWPLAARLSTTLPVFYVQGEGAPVAEFPADSLQLYWFFWLFHKKVGDFDVPHMYQDEFAIREPGPVMLWGFPATLAYAALEPVVGDIAAYNLVLILTFPLTGLSMYLLARLVTGSRMGALMAAVIYSCHPWRVAKAVGGHLFGYLLFLPPLVIWLVERGLRRRSPLSMIGAGLCLVVLAISLDAYLIYYFGILFGLYLALRLAWELRSRGRVRRILTSLRLLAPVLVAGIFVVAYVYLRFYRLLGGTSYGSVRGIDEIARFSADWPAFTERGGPDAERLLYLGWAWLAVPLALVQHLLLPRGSWKRPALAVLLAAAALVGVGLCLGPNIDSVTGVKLYPLLARIPGFEAARVPTHAFLFVSIGVSLAAALAVSPLGSLATSAPRRRRAILTACGFVALAGIVADLRVVSRVQVFSDLMEYETDPTLAELRRAPGPRKSVLLPASSPQGVSHAEYFATLSETPMADGYSPMPPGNWFDLMYRLRRVSFGVPIGQDLHDLLLRYGITHVLFYRKPYLTYPYGEEHIRPVLDCSPYLRRQAESAVFGLYRVERSPEPRDCLPPARFPAAEVPGDSRVGHLNVRSAPSSVPAGTAIAVSVEIHNGAVLPWPGEASGSVPVRVACWWAPGDSPSARANETRGYLPQGLAAGASERIVITTTAPEIAGAYELSLQVMQEGVGFWPIRQQVPVTVTAGPR